MTNTVTRHLSVTANATASIDDIAGGRSILGIGSGDTAVHLVGKKSIRLSVMREALGVLRALLDGEPVGTRWGKHRYKVPSLFGLSATRSLEGSTAVAIAGSLAAMLALMVAGFPLPVAAGTALACGLLGCAVEAISHHGLDNLTIQLAGAGVARMLLG